MSWRPVRRCSALAVTGLTFALLGCSDGDTAAAPDAAQPTPLPPAPSGWTRHEVDRSANGPAFTAVSDLNGDGRVDLVTGHLGHLEGSTPPDGLVTAYLQGDSLDDWERTEIMPPNPSVPFPNHAELADLDGDGDVDVIVPSGFLVCTLFSNQCGAIIWYENEGDHWTPHEIIPPSDRLFYHSAILVDFDGDGLEDIVTVGEHFSAATSEAHTMWLRGTDGPARFSGPPLPIGEGGGSLPSVLDIDGDGDLDVASAEFFVAGESAVWFERTAEPSADNPAGTFERHVIEAGRGSAIQLSFIRGLRGGDELWAVLANHTSVHRDEPASGVFLYQVPRGASVRDPWFGESISEGIVSEPDEGLGREAAPGIFGHGDIDNDGDMDLLVSGDGDPKIYWLEQLSNGEFATRVLQDHLPQGGSTIVMDFDGDGTNEALVSGYEHDALLIYQKQ